MNANTIELNINESSEHSKHMTSCEQMAQVWFLEDRDDAEWYDKSYSVKSCAQ
jgi:hypothetical protein